MSISHLGLTLDQYAGVCGLARRDARETYLRMMRESRGIEDLVTSRSQASDGVVKFCLPVEGGYETESVIIPMDSYRGTSWHTLCVSSQVGCRMGCTFCETGRMGLLRNLTPGEIVQQRIAARQLMQKLYGAGTGEYRYFRDGIQNVVFMGMGEPLDNFDNLIQAIRAMTDQNGLAIPYAQITVSSVGKLDGIRALAELARREPAWRNLRLAISLNAPSDELRTSIMPINKSMPLAELQQTLLDYPLPPRGRLLIEYVLMAGINDSIDHADQVAAWARPLPCVVNLIPYNPQSDASFGAPADDTVLRFQYRLRELGIFAKWRVTRGRDLMGACGQLGNPALRRATNAPAKQPSVH